MTSPIISILSCLVILATASGIKMRRMRELERSQKLLETDNSVTVLGEGMEINQLPIVVYSLKPGVLEMMIYTRSNKSCYFQFPYLTDTAVKFKTVKQLTVNRVIVLWSIYDKVKVATTVTLYDVDLCAPLNKYEFSAKLSFANMVAVVPFNNGFELITWDNHRAAYDTNGHLRGTKENFPINSSDFSVSPVSQSTRDKGYFIVDYTRKVLNFVRADGTLNRQLLNLTLAEVLTNNRHSLYSACAFNPKHKFTVTCYLYDEAGNWLWANSALFDFDTVLDVETLEGGGTVFAASKSEGKMFFAKIGNTLEDVNTWDYTGEQTFDEAKLLGFSKENQTFDLAYKLHVQGSGTEAVVLQTFVLEN